MALPEYNRPFMMPKKYIGMEIIRVKKSTGTVYEIYGDLLDGWQHQCDFTSADLQLKYNQWDYV